MLIDQVLKATQGNLSEASTRLGISRPTLRSRLKQLGLTRH
ncbi:helix-turn-helix domain-containing protein [Crateriforma spongiae]